MSFHIDRQTREELNISGRHRAGSVFHLFNKVKSRGGAQWLEEMFRHPLNDAAAINERSRTIRYFQELNISFPFDAQQLTVVREFTDAGAAGTALMWLARLLVQKLLSTFVHDERLKKTVQGLHATILTLRHCRDLVRQLQHPPGRYASRVAEIRKILEDPMAVRLYETDIYQPVSLKSLAAFEHFLKGRFHSQMEKLLSFIYEVDVFIAVSDVARAQQFAYADAKPAAENCFHARDLKHPAIAGAIGNTIQMDSRKNVLFLTGANMAGKSTLMKSIGIALYLAHMGFPVAASAMSFSVRQGIYTSINTADNIGMGYSHFYAEVMRVKEAAEAVSQGKDLLLIFDEMFKGTNVKDAYDGTFTVTEAFAGYRNCLLILSTHIIEVGEALQHHEQIRFAYLPTVLEGSRPRYTYRLEQGITEDRQGMMIIRNEGILEMIAG